MGISFKKLQLLIEEHPPSQGDLEYVANKEGEPYKDGAYRYKITTRISGNYFWLYACYGSSTPYSKTVYNERDSVEEVNPRESFQAEMNRQIFVLYDSKTEILYLSELDKKAFLIKYLSESLRGKDVHLKNFMLDIDKFLERINGIKQIRFVKKRTLFDHGHKLFDILPFDKDPFGFGEPEQLKVEFKYGFAKISGNFKEIIKTLVTRRKENRLDSLVCVGENDNKVERVFNINGLAETIKVNIAVADNGMYVESEVQKELIRKAEKQNE